MKKLIILCVVIAVALSTLVGCGPTDGSTDDQVRIFAAIGALSPDNSEKTIIQQMTENIPINIVWETVSVADRTERKNLVLGAGTDLPDAFMAADLSDFELLSNGSRGVFIPLEDFITPEIMPNLYAVMEKRPELWGALTFPDGHIYGLPRIGEMGFEHDGRQYQIGSIRHFTLINQRWLDELGLDMPETIGEFTEVLKAFRDKDPNIIPLGFNNNNNFCGNLKMFYTAFGLTDFHDAHRNYNNGLVSFGALDPRLKDVVNMFHYWSEEGLLDIEGFTQDDTQYIAKGRQGLFGAMTWWEIDEISGDFADDYVFLPPLRGDDGTFALDIAETGTVTRGYFSVTSNATNPELLLRWIDQVYDPLISMQVMYGPIGEFYYPEPDELGFFRMRTLEPGESAGERRGRLEILGPHALLSEYTTQFWELEPRALERLDYLRYFWLPHVTNHTSFPSPVSFTEEELLVLDRVPDITDFTSEMFARWVRHGTANEDWDDYVQQLERLGVHEVVAVWQAAADRFHAAAGR